MNNYCPISEPMPPEADRSHIAADPHPRLAELRALHPLAKLAPGRYLVLRAEDVIPLMTDPRTRHIEGPDYVTFSGIPSGVTARFLSRVFLLSNGECHRSRRSLFVRSCAQNYARVFRGKIRSAADRIIAEMPSEERFDFVQQVASRISTETIAAILGLPSDDGGYFTYLVRDLSRALAPHYPHQHHDQIENAVGELFDYLETQLRMRRVEPRDDLLSSLLADWQSSQVITFEDLIFQVLGLVVGGRDTMRNSFAMLVANLNQHPELWEILRQNRKGIPSAVAESLRFDPPVGAVHRRTTEPIRVGNTWLPAGTDLVLSLMSAQRDPAIIESPERFDIFRSSQTCRSPSVSDHTAALAKCSPE